MSMNQYMHPRNIYKQPPNFKQLAVDYPEFRKYVTHDISGKVNLDFKNIEALRALTYTLLKKDFNLDLQIPLNKLIPTVPLRLNYILWIEDLLNVAKRDTDVKGIDIGTGASCIYPLIAAKKNGWKMVATDIDTDSIKYAIDNVNRNNLNDLVQIVEVAGDALLKEVLEHHPGDYDFCMCNPPFFASTQELHPLFKARNMNRPHPRNAFCASVDEVVAKGGEVEYLTKLINESKQIECQIRIYTTMVGHKSSLPPLKRLLREAGVVSFKQTEFCQGHTTRWGLAWTFLDIDLRQIPQTYVAAKHQIAKPLLYEVPLKIENTTINDIGVICEKLDNIFKSLLIEVEMRRTISKRFLEYVLIAYTDTWSHQRRKRREQQRLDKGDEPTVSNNGDEIQTTCTKLAEIGIEGAGMAKKRELDDDGFYLTKKIKTSYNNNLIYLKFKINVKQEETIQMEFNYIEGHGTKEAMHQVVQYIKNNLFK